MSKKKLRYFIIHKPYGMLSQFTPEHGKTCLADLDYKFPRDVYPVGRLDQDSEGLLLLTNDKSINHELLTPEKKHSKTYLVQVEGVAAPEALQKLETGVDIKAKGETHHTAPAGTKLVEQPEWIHKREPPVRDDKTTSWIEISITEGKNRQVRKMTAAVGLPTLRLFRIRIEGIKITGLDQGRVMELSKNTAFNKLRLSQ
ncbi:MAG: pseudouridine synthase [Flavobacteriales bacterium]|nr:pseudouridine synthase [Flavobacteriales bacterium]